MASQHPIPATDFSGAEYLDTNRNQKGTEKPKGAAETPAAQERAGSGFVWQEGPPPSNTRLFGHTLLLESYFDLCQGLHFGFPLCMTREGLTGGALCPGFSCLWLVWMYLYFQPLSHQWFWCKTVCPLPRKSRCTEDSEDCVQSAVLLGRAVSGL